MACMACAPSSPERRQAGHHERREDEQGASGDSGADRGGDGEGSGQSVDHATIKPRLTETIHS